MTSNEIVLRFDIDARRVVAMVGQMMAGMERLGVEVVQGARSVQGALNKTEEASRKVGASLQETSKTTQHLDQSTKSLDGSVTRLAAHIAAATGALQTVRGFMEQVLTTTLEMEKAQRTLQYATGDGAAAMAFVRRTCQELGLELVSTAQAYAKFAASTRGTALEGYQTQYVFKAVASAATVMGLSAEETHGALVAMGQMISKNKVMAEELRGQLGERLPGAFLLAAKAMGVTTQQLDKMLQEGKVVASDFLPKFARELNNALGDQTYLASLGPTAQINRLKTAFTELLVAVGQSGPLKQATQDMGEMAKSLKDASENGVPRDLGRFMAGGISLTKGLASVLWVCRQEVLGLAAAYGVFLAMKVAGGIYEWIKAKRGLITEIRTGRSEIIQNAVAMSGLTYQTNQSALAQLNQARALVQAKLEMLGSRVATGELTIAGAAQERQALMTAQAELAKAEAVATGGRAASVAATATKLLGGPLGWITMLLTVGVGAWVAWGGSAETAAERAHKAAEKTERSRQTYEALAGDIQELNKVLEDSKTKADDKRRAQEQLNTVVRQMLLDYPKANDYIQREGENYVVTLDALKKITEQRKVETLELKKQTETSIAAARARMVEAQANAALYASMPVMGTVSTSPELARHARKVDLAKKEIADLEAVLKDQEAILQKYQAQEARLNAPKQGNTKSDKPAEASTTALERLKADLEQRKYLYEQEAYNRGQLVEYSKAQEATWLQENISHYALSAKERMQADKMLFEARRATMAASEDAEVASLRRQMDEAKGQAAERLRLVTALEERVKLRHGADSKEAQAAAAEVSRVKREALQEDLRFREAVADRQKVNDLALLEAEGQMLERRKALGDVRGRAYLVALEDLETRKYQIQQIALDKRIELLQLDPAHDPRQVEQLRSQLEALAAQYNSKRAEIGFQANDIRDQEDGKLGALKGIDDYVTQSQDRFAAWSSFTGNLLRGLEQNFASFFESIFTKGTTAGQKWDALWKGIARTVIQALSQMAAQWLVSKIAAALFGKSIADAAKAKAVAEQHAAATGIFAAHSYIPFAGPAIAAGLVAMMNVTLGANLAAAKGLTAFAKGGLIDRPTIALMGEAGEELVAPKQDFLDWAQGVVLMGADLQARLDVNQERIWGYRSDSAQYTRQAEAQGNRNLLDGRPFLGSQTYIDNRGTTFIGVDDRKWSDMVMRGVRNHEGSYS